MDARLCRRRRHELPVQAGGLAAQQADAAAEAMLAELGLPITPVLSTRSSGASSSPTTSRPTSRRGWRRAAPAVGPARLLAVVAAEQDRGRHLSPYLAIRAGAPRLRRPALTPAIWPYRSTYAPCALVSLPSPELICSRACPYATLQPRAAPMVGIVPMSGHRDHDRRTSRRAAPAPPSRSRALAGIRAGPRGRARPRARGGPRAHRRALRRAGHPRRAPPGARALPRPVGSTRTPTGRSATSPRPRDPRRAHQRPAPTAAARRGRASALVRLSARPSRRCTASWACRSSSAARPTATSI